MVGDGGDRRSCGEDPDLPREGSLSSLITHLLQSFLRICTFLEIFFSFFCVLRAITAVRAHCAPPKLNRVKYSTDLVYLPL